MWLLSCGQLRICLLLQHIFYVLTVSTVNKLKGESSAPILRQATPQEKEVDQKWDSYTILKNFFGINEAQCYKKCRALPGKKKFLNSVSSYFRPQAISVIFLNNITCPSLVEFPTHYNHLKNFWEETKSIASLPNDIQIFVSTLIVGCLSLFLRSLSILFPSSSTYKCIPAVIPFHLHFLLPRFQH